MKLKKQIMCFSAGASFGIGTALLVGGAISLSKVKHRAQIPFAAIPLLFSAQQFSEGFIWLGLTKIDWALRLNYYTNFYLILAQVVWPVMVPLSIGLMEKNALRKKIIGLSLFIGILTSAYFGYSLLMYPIHCSIHLHHIRYDVEVAGGVLNLSNIGYFLAAIIPAFVSGIKKMFIFGSTLFVTLVLALFFFSENVVSVWCFFAAALSILIIFILSQNQTALATSEE